MNDKKYISSIKMHDEKIYALKDAEARSQLENVVDAVQAAEGSGLKATLEKTEGAGNTVTIGWDETVTIIFDGGQP